MAQSDEEDIFDSALGLDDSHLQHGFDDGFRDGLRSGRIEGRETGLRVGFQQGEELGFYQGCSDMWREAMSKAPHAFSARCQRNVGLLREQLHAMIPACQDHNDERLQDRMEMIRARFRAILAMLSVHIHQYEGYPGGGISASSSSAAAAASASPDQQEDRSADF